MLKVGTKRRRTVKQIRAEKEAQAEKDRILNEKLAMFDRMQEEVEQLKQQDRDREAASILLSKMINAGLVQQKDNNSILVNSQNGQQEIRLNE